MAVKNSLDWLMEHAYVLVDTREQDTPAFRQRMAALQMPYERRKLDAGDYMIAIRDEDGHEIIAPTAVERKMDLTEMCACCTTQRARFERELQRAAAAGTKIWILIENASWLKAANGTYRSKVHPNALLGSLFAWANRYDVHILLCNEAITARLIRELLLRSLQEELRKGEENEKDT